MRSSLQKFFPQETCKTQQDSQPFPTIACAGWSCLHCSVVRGPWATAVTLCDSCPHRTFEIMKRLSSQPHAAENHASPRKRKLRPVYTCVHIRLRMQIITSSIRTKISLDSVRTELTCQPAMAAERAVCHRHCLEPNPRLTQTELLLEEIGCCHNLIMSIVTGEHPRAPARRGGAPHHPQSRANDRTCRDSPRQNPWAQPPSQPDREVGLPACSRLPSLAGTLTFLNN